jgi:predicted acetyltransferase
MATPEFRLYYDTNGKVITYSTEHLPNKDFIIVTIDQYAEARSDVIVINKKVVYTHNKKCMGRLIKSNAGIKTSKYDVNIILDTESECNFWQKEINVFE